MFGMPSDVASKNCSGGSLARVFVFAKLNRNVFTMLFPMTSVLPTAAVCARRLR